jgi:hypothetical protein
VGEILRSMVAPTGKPVIVAVLPEKVPVPVVELEETSCHVKLIYGWLTDGRGWLFFFNSICFDSKER